MRHNQFSLQQSASGLVQYPLIDCSVWIRVCGTWEHAGVSPIRLSSDYAGVTLYLPARIPVAYTKEHRYHSGVTTWAGARFRFIIIVIYRRERRP